MPDSGPATELKYLDEYVAFDETQQPQSDVDAEIIYVGYGIEAPEYHWDDYKGVDVRGKVLLMLVNEPPSDRYQISSRARRSLITAAGPTNMKRLRAKAP